VPPERSLIVAAASLSLAVYSYPLPLALLRLRAPAQGFLRILNTELISYFSLQGFPFFHFDLRQDR
jgi:hypothetical protein